MPDTELRSSCCLTKCFGQKVQQVDGEHAGLQFTRLFNVDRLNATEPFAGDGLAHPFVTFGRDRAGADP